MIWTIISRVDVVSLPYHLLGIDSEFLFIKYPPVIKYNFMEEMGSKTCAWDFATYVWIQGPFNSLARAIAPGVLSAAGTYAAYARITKEFHGKATAYIYSAINGIIQPRVLKQNQYKPENLQ